MFRVPVSITGLTRSTAVNYIVIQEANPMPANALVQARIDESIKQEAAVVLSTMGLTVSDAVRMLLVRVAREHALPFEPLVPNEHTIAAMQEARTGSLRSVENVEQLLSTIDAED
jgi:DNA-damage-inducible protein J